MSLFTVRAKVRPDAVPHVDAAVATMFTALEEAAPPHVRYTSCRLADGVTNLILLQVDDGTDNPLPAMPEFQQFQAGLRGWLDGPPENSPATVIGAYRMF